jgi:hypothetical protein
MIIFVVLKNIKTGKKEEEAERGGLGSCMQVSSQS